MQVSELQSLIAHMRSRIHSLEEFVEFYKSELKHGPQYSTKPTMRNSLQSARRKIVKCVEIQRSLKHEIAEIIRTERILRSIDKYNIVPFMKFRESA